MPELRDQLLHALADRYAIEREIGAGGMATVYLARDLKHDRQVALKVLDPELAAVMGVEKNFSWGRRLTPALGLMLVVAGITVVAVGSPGSACAC